MGYDLPAAIGACIGSGKQEVVCLTGDGSIQINIQELQTIVHHRLPIKIFVLNNDGYVSMKQTQDAYFNSRYVACNADSGVSFPDIRKVAEAYGLATALIDTHEGLKEKVERVLGTPGPVLSKVMLSHRVQPEALLRGQTGRQDHLQTPRGHVSVPAPGRVLPEHDHRTYQGRLVQGEGGENHEQA